MKEALKKVSLFPDTVNSEVCKFILFVYYNIVWPKIGLVRFAQDLCTTYEGYYGTCVTRRQCEHIRGIQSGSCTTNGLGRCCMSMIVTKM